MGADALGSSPKGGDISGGQGDVFDLLPVIHNGNLQ